MKTVWNSAKTLVMKWLFSLLLTLPAFAAKPVVLVSYFDAFNRAPFNNSKNVALGLAKSLAHSSVQLELCPIETKYEVGYAQLETCFKKLSSTPVLVLSLGEFNCKMKIEIMGRNRDKTITSPDNAGVERHNSRIIPEGENYLGLKYPAPEMYCALTPSERSRVAISNDAGSFVCNNTAYLMSHYYSEIQYGFIHVPSNNCGNLAAITEESTQLLAKMILKGAEVERDERLPTTRKELKRERSANRGEACKSEFFERVTVPGPFQ